MVEKDQGESRDRERERGEKAMRVEAWSSREWGRRRVAIPASISVKKKKKTRRSPASVLPAFYSL